MMACGPDRKPKTGAFFTREQWLKIGEKLRSGASRTAIYREMSERGEMPYRSLKSFINSVAWAAHCGYLEHK